MLKYADRILPTTLRGPLGQDKYLRTLQDIAKISQPLFCQLACLPAVRLLGGGDTTTTQTGHYPASYSLVLLSWQFRTAAAERARASRFSPLPPPNRKMCARFLHSHATKHNGGREVDFVMEIYDSHLYARARKCENKHREETLER